MVLALFCPILSCKQGETQKSIVVDREREMTEFNEVVRCLTEEYFEVAVIRQEAVSVRRVENVIRIDDPILGNVCKMDSTYFFGWAAQKLIDSTDAVYMYASIDSTKVYALDSVRIGKPTIHAKELRSLFSSYGTSDTYDTIVQRYGRGGVLVTSVPVFNEAMDRAVVEVASAYAALAGSGHIILLGKINGKWQILENYELWVS